MSLFTQTPLAERMRPNRLDDLIGQTHLVGPSGIIRQAIRMGNVPSMILWGPRSRGVQAEGLQDPPQGPA